MGYVNQISFSIFNSPWWIFFSIYISECFMNSVGFLMSLPVASSSTAEPCCMEKHANFAGFVLPHAGLTEFVLFLLEDTVNSYFLFTFCKIMSILSSVISPSEVSRSWWVICLIVHYLWYAHCRWLFFCISVDLVWLL